MPSHIGLVSGLGFGIKFVSLFFKLLNILVLVGQKQVQQKSAKLNVTNCATAAPLPPFRIPQPQPYHHHSERRIKDPNPNDDDIMITLTLFRFLRSQFWDSDVIIISQIHNATVAPVPVFRSMFLGKQVRCSVLLLQSRENARGIIIIILTTIKGDKYVFKVK